MPTLKQTTTSQPATRTIPIFDVARPGDLKPADATARPVIVSNRMIVQDPMMAPLPVANVSPTALEPAPKLTVKPLHTETPPLDRKLRRGFDGNGDGVVQNDESSPPVLEGGPALTSDQAADTPETVSGPAAADKEAAQLEADAKVQDELDTLTDQKTYFLPINAVEQRRSRHVLIAGAVVIIILGLAQIDIALDAGFITIGNVHAPTHLFHK